MLKQSVLMLALSIIVVYLAKYIVNVLHALGAAQIFLISQLTLWLPEFAIKVVVVEVIVLIVVPVLISLLVAFGYWLVKRAELPFWLELTWIMWIVSSLIFVMHA